MAVQPSLATRQWTMLAAPPALIITMYLAFQWSVGRFGFPLGYLIAFAFYCGVWCLSLPIVVLGRRGVSALFLAPGSRFTELRMGIQALLWWPVIFPLAFVFLPQIANASSGVVLASVAIGVIVGTTEELLWRGVYVALFSDNVWLSTIYPSMAFGLWHLCPLAAVPSRHPGGTVSFVVYAIALGLSYAQYARHTRSIRWCSVSHCIHDSLGLGGFAYITWLS